MYAYIRGKIVAKEVDRLILESNQIGYEIYCEPAVLSLLPAINEETKVYTFMQVSDDGISLYGFASKEAKELFLQLIKVNGIGAKLGSSIIAATDPAQLSLAIINNDTKLLCSIKGIGKKTAQRIILELQDKLKAENFPATAGTVELNSSEMSLGGVAEEAASALRLLGYNKLEAETAVSSVLKQKPDLGIEELIRLALRGLAKV